MAKKYLLYIHDPRFEKEPAKSALVNALLSEYYKAKINMSAIDTVLPQKLKFFVEQIAPAQIALKETPIMVEEVKPKQKEVAQIKYCKHNYPMGLCKFGCKK